MAFTKSFIMMVALALVMGQPAASSSSRANWENIEKACIKILNEITGDRELQRDVQKAFNFTRNWIEEMTLPFSAARKVVPALEAVLKSECSSSWQNVVTLTKCLENRDSNVFREPLRDYTNKCLESVYVSKKVKSETGGFLSGGVSFINDEFIKKYLEDNPGERPLHLNQIKGKGSIEDCCKPDKSYGAVLRAIEQHYAKRNKDPAKKLDGQAAVKRYLDDKLSIPCKHYSSRLVTFQSEIGLASKYFEGGEEALLASLDEKAQRALFRLKYCNQLEFTFGNVVINVDNLLRSKPSGKPKQ